MSYSKENHIRIYDDQSGAYISVSPDFDGLDLCEIRDYASDSRSDKPLSSIVMTIEQGRLVADAILETCARIEQQMINAKNKKE
jgi:hypothetical protein